MKRILLVVSTVLTAGAIVGGMGGCAKDALPPVVDIDTLLTDGWQLYKEGKFQEALAKFDSAVLYADPANIEAHLGKGLALVRLGNFSKAHEEFALIYSPYVQENLKVLRLFVPASMEDTLGDTLTSSPYMVGKRTALLPGGGTYALAVWKLGRILRYNGVDLETAEAVYLPVDILSLIVDPAPDDPDDAKSIDPALYITAITPTVEPLSVSSSSVSYVDTVDGPVVFFAAVSPGLAEAALLVDWMADTVDDTVRMSLVTMRIRKDGLGDKPDLVWMAVAADAYAYYLDPSNTYKRRGAYLAYVAYMLFPWRGDIPSDKRYSGVDGLSVADSVVLKGLLGLATLGYYRDKLVGNAVSLIRFYGDNTFPNPYWTYFPTSATEMTWSVGYTRDTTFNSEMYSKINELFFGR